MRGGAGEGSPEKGVRRAFCPQLTSLLGDLLPLVLLVMKGEDLCPFPEPLPSLSQRCGGGLAPRRWAGPRYPKAEGFPAGHCPAVGRTSLLPANCVSVYVCFSQLSLLGRLLGVWLEVFWGGLVEHFRSAYSFAGLLTHLWLLPALSHGQRELSSAGLPALG